MPYSILVNVDIEEYADVLCAVSWREGGGAQGEVAERVISARGELTVAVPRLKARLSLQGGSNPSSLLKGHMT